jgi:hypothetical protein
MFCGLQFCGEAVFGPQGAVIALAEDPRSGKSYLSAPGVADSKGGSPGAPARPIYAAVRALRTAAGWFLMTSM